MEDLPPKKTDKQRMAIVSKVVEQRKKCSLGMIISPADRGFGTSGTAARQEEHGGKSRWAQSLSVHQALLRPAEDENMKIHISAVDCIHMQPTVFNYELTGGLKQRECSFLGVFFPGINEKYEIVSLILLFA